ncbi:MAG: lipid A biosynthesis acyltransferase [Betaproteobacteria bacterium]|nr:lipid A biosynthesis acyltransferase [Betaproteobacteria bacterium]
MTALFVGFMRLLSITPLNFIRGLGQFLGWLLWALMKSRKHIVQTNLRLCFPEKPIEEIKQLTRAHFVQFAQSLLDRAWLWHAPMSVVESRLKWVGTPVAFSQLAADTPKIILAPHFVGLDAGGLALTLKASKPVAFIFVPQHNKVMDAWVNEGRQRTGNVKPYFRHEGVKQIMSGLRHGEILHLSPDMDFGPEESLFVPFMGVTAATVPSLSRFARLGRAQVLTLVTRMTPQGYEMTLQEAWDNFPTAHLFEDTLRMNTELAEHIRAMPTQYYWVHKRFKTRPEGEASVYKNAAI